MAVDEAILIRAKRGDRAAVEAIVAESHPVICRIALGLTGRTDVGMGVVRFVVKRALPALPSWKTPDAPHRWFLHHTILTTRRAAKHKPGKPNDTLVDEAAGTPAYVAFIRALRGLPMQQREAFILHHGERLNERFSAVAMDCSVIAAANHLNAAAAALKPIGGNDYFQFQDEMTRVYRTLNCTESFSVPKLRGVITRHLWSKRLVRLSSLLIVLAMIAAVAWFCIKVVPMLRF